MQAWLFDEGQGFMAYASHGVNFIRVASYVDRILKGTKPGTLPIEQPTNYGLFVNLKAAKELGLVVPSSIIAQAERVYD
jgi:putative ABC transport system substrate-binding protein